MAYTKFFKSLVNDPIRKIFAIVFAFALWLFVAVENSYTFARNARLVFTGIPDSLIVVDPPTDIRVTFNGRGRSLFNFWIVQPRVSARIPATRSGEYRIATKDISIPSLAEDVRASYELPVLDVRVDEKIRKTISAVVPIKGKWRAGYSVGTITILDTLEVTGPRTYLRDLGEVATESLDLKNRSRTFEQRLKIILPASSILPNKQWVTARIEIDTTAARVFTNIMLKTVTRPGQFVSLTNGYVDTLVIAGTVSRISKVKKSDIDIALKSSDLLPGEYYLPAEITLPEYVMPIYSFPKKFKVKVF